jgi:predicted transcriptional regulator
MHEIYDGFTPRELKALAYREAGMTYREIGELLGYTGARAGKIYQKACRKRERWISKHDVPRRLLWDLEPMLEQLKELT